MNLKKIPLLALPLLGLSALGLGLFQGEAPLPPHAGHLPPLPEGSQVVTGPSVADTVRSDATPPRSPVGVLGAPVGSHFLYAFATARSLRMETEGSSPKNLSLRGEGKLGLAIVARRGKEVLVEIRCRDLELTGSGPAPQAGAHLDDLAGRLRNCPVLIRMGDDGRHLALRFGEGADAEVQQWLRNLVSCLQLVVDEDATGEWEVEETDMGGRCLVRYAWKQQPGDGEPGILDKRKLRVLELGGGDDLEIETEVTGRLAARVGGALGWILSCAGQEDWRVEMPEMKSRVHTRRTIDLNLLTSSFAPVDAADWDGPWQSLVQRGDAQARERRLESMRERLAHLSLMQGAVDLLAAVAGGDANMDAIYEARERLLWLVRLHPEELEQLRGLILQQAPESPGAGALLAAIGGAETAAAEHFLGSFLGDALLPDGLRTSAAIALFQIKAPNVDTVASVVRLVDQGEGRGLLRRTGLLLFGRYARGQGEHIETLLAFEDQARKEDLQRTWLEALGNARSDRALTCVPRYLRDESPSTRAAAVHVLEALGGPEPTRLMVEQLECERSPHVRGELAIALSARTSPEAMAAVDRILAGDPSEGVRERALRGLAQQRTSTAHGLIARAAHQDGSQRLRDLASQILQGWN